MRWLLSLIFVMVTLSSAFATETKTEYITEEVCHAVAGCWVDTKTGECPDCVTETRKVVTVINVPIKDKVKKKFRSYGNNWNNTTIIAATNIPTKRSGKCIVGVCAWLNEKD